MQQGTILHNEDQFSKAWNDRMEREGNNSHQQYHEFGSAKNKKERKKKTDHFLSVWNITKKDQINISIYM